MKWKAKEAQKEVWKIKRQRETVDVETHEKNKEVSDSDRHATNYDDEWLTVNA